ncbi:MAG: hypothetical protein ACTHKY_11350 [Ginsengibacter sp.]
MGRNGEDTVLDAVLVDQPSLRALLTLLWDKNGKKYGKGKGFIIYANGKKIYSGKDLKHVMAKM